MASELATTHSFGMIPAQEIKMQVNGIQQLMADVMKNGTHYGIVPGCGDKPTLLQPGAQKLMLMFQLADEYEVDQTDLDNRHREYRVKCRLISKLSGHLQGEGLGICTTMESKYRYRNVADYKITGDPIPEDAKERKKEYRAQGFGMKKVDGVWEWVKFSDAEKQENPDIADVYNTVLKMACKRALVAAVLNSLAASDIFTQDLEDMDKTPSQSTPQTKTEHKTEQQRRLGEMMSQGAENGLKVSAMRAEIEEKIGRKLAELNDYECEKAIEIIAELIADKQQLEAAQDLATDAVDTGTDTAASSDALYEEDVPF